MVELLVNGESRTFKSATVAELTNELGLGGRRVAIELNLQIVPRSEYETTRLESGDRLEIVQCISGG